MGTHLGTHTRFLFMLTRRCGELGLLEFAGALGVEHEGGELGGFVEGDALRDEDVVPSGGDGDRAFAGDIDLGLAGAESFVALEAGVLVAELAGVDFSEAVGGVRVLPGGEIEDGDGAGGCEVGFGGIATCAGPIEAAVPGGGEVAGCVFAAEEFEENLQIELADLADVVRLVEVVEEGVKVSHLRNGRGVLLFVLEGVEDLPGGGGWVVEHAGKGSVAALVHPDVLLEAKAVAIGEEHGLGEHERRAGHDGGTRIAGRNLASEEVNDFGVADEGFAGGLEKVVGEDGSGLTFEDSFAGVVHLVAGDVVEVFMVIFGDAGGGLVAPFFEVGVLILKCVGEFVGEDGFLGIGVEPVEEVDCAGFGVVIAGDLLGEKAEEEGAEIEVAVEKAEFFEDDFTALHALGVFVVFKAQLEVGLDFSAGDEASLDLVMDGKAGFSGGEVEEIVDGFEKLFGLLWGDAGGGLGGRLGDGLVGGLRGVGFGLRRGGLREGGERECGEE